MDGFDLPSWSMFVPGVAFSVAAAAALLLGARSRFDKLSSLLTVVAGAVCSAIAFNALLQDSVARSSGWSPAPYIEITFRLDPLRAWFLLVIGLPAIATGLFAIGYLAPGGADLHHGPHRRWTDATIAVFLASMALLVLADSVVAFLLFWEIMALASFFLVIGDGRNALNRRSAYIYAVMTHAGTAFLILMFMVLARNAGSLEFVSFRASIGDLEPWEKQAVFVLAVFGFGAKAGLIPLHVWLPRAHPAAPGHASALMSGVMVKMAIFGLVLVLFEFVDDLPVWWGAVLVALGAVSAVLGILYSLMERDMKRLLAYSTVENVGIVTVGVGASVVLMSEGLPELAALALAAALFHSLNHALFKGLLFFVAGSVQRATGTRDLERLGGLIRHMPITAALALAGAAAIAALPPLNGFASEWMLFQSLFSLGSATESSVVGTGTGLTIAALALTGALALAGFVRFFGMAFLAQSRSHLAVDATESSRSMLAGMGLLAGLCLILGVVPMVAVRLLEPVTTMLVRAQPGASPGWSGSLDADNVSGNYVPLLVILLLLLVGVLPWLIARLSNGKPTERVAPTWACGFDLQPRMQYTATAFAKPLRLIFHSVLRPERTVVIDRSESPYVTNSIRYDEQLKPVYERFLYEPFVTAMVTIAKRVRTLQSGSIRLYLSFFFVTLLVVIVLAR